MPTVNSTKTKRYLLLAGGKDTKPGWSCYIMDSNYPTSLFMYVPENCSWYEIVDMVTKEIVISKYDLNEEEIKNE
jgi:hypothetical protein